MTLSPTHINNTFARILFAMSGDVEYWRGAVACLRWEIADDSAADGETVPMPTMDPDSPSQYWAGWNSVKRLAPTAADLVPALEAACERQAAETKFADLLRDNKLDDDRVFGFIGALLPAAIFRPGQPSKSFVAGTGPVGHFGIDGRTLEVVIRSRLVQMGWTHVGRARRLDLDTWNWGEEFLSELRAVVAAV